MWPLKLRMRRSLGGGIESEGAFEVGGELSEVGAVVVIYGEEEFGASLFMALRRKLEGKVAIITGGASGIGEATARDLFAEHGARAIVIADIQDVFGQNVAKSIGSGQCTYMHCDVTDEDQVKALVESTVKNFRQLDIMFSNAGTTNVTTNQAILDFDLNASDRIFAINVRGVVACVKHAARSMVGGGVKGGSIICTGSVLASFAPPQSIDYVMSKRAVSGLVECASKGLGKYGIRDSQLVTGQNLIVDAGLDPHGLTKAD
ncbi:hypothetical protein AgCh_014805 [Apium graveolens]